MKQIVLNILGILAFLFGMAIPYVLPPHDKGKEFSTKQTATVISIFIVLLLAIVFVSKFL